MRYDNVKYITLETTRHLDSLHKSCISTIRDFVNVLTTIAVQQTAP